MQNAEWTLFDPAPPYESTSTYGPQARQPSAPVSPLWRFVTSLLPEEDQVKNTGLIDSYIIISKVIPDI